MRLLRPARNDREGEGLRMTRLVKLNSLLEKELNFMAKIDRFSFGSIIINGKKYFRDVLILADGTVKRRKGGFLMFGSHNIKKEEIEELSHGEPETIVIGTGTSGKASVALELENWAQEKSLNLIVQPSHEAVARLNELIKQKRKVAALIHITC